MFSDPLSFYPHSCYNKCMFTGIIEETGVISEFAGGKIRVKCSKVLEETHIGESIAVNGVCLTVVDIGNDYFSANISSETLKTTMLKSGMHVNLERALKLSGRLGGHIVTGHIDTVGKLEKDINSLSEIQIRFDKSFGKYVVRKGSIAINGISLTTADCGEDFVTIALIPQTLNTTCLRYLKKGDNVNIEFDILSKYVEKNLLSADNNSITEDFLSKNGFI